MAVHGGAKNAVVVVTGTVPTNAIPAVCILEDYFSAVIPT